MTTGERLDHCKTRESFYCSRLFRKMPNRRTTDTEPMDRILLWVVNHKANGDPSVLNCTQTYTEDDHPIRRSEVEAAVQSLKKGKSAGVDNIPAELVQVGREALTAMCNKTWQTGEWSTPWTQSLVITLSKKGNLQQCQNYRTISLISVLYTPPLSTVIEKHSVFHHSYADDSQLQKSAPPQQIPDHFLSMQKCIDDIKSWMTLKILN